MREGINMILILSGKTSKTYAPAKDPALPKRLKTIIKMIGFMKSPSNIRIVGFALCRYGKSHSMPRLHAPFSFTLPCLTGCLSDGKYLALSRKTKCHDEAVESCSVASRLPGV